MATLETINNFTSQKNIAVAGVSRKKQKFGNAIYKELTKRGYNVYPLNPNLEEYNGKTCYKDITSLPEEVTGIVINTKPETTKVLVKEAETKRLKNIWLQQGSVDKETIKELETSNPEIITKECILMFGDSVKGIHGFHRWLNKVFGKLPS